MKAMIPSFQLTVTVQLMSHSSNTLSGFCNNILLSCISFVTRLPITLIFQSSHTKIFFGGGSIVRGWTISNTLYIVTRRNPISHNFLCWYNNRQTHPNINTHYCQGTKPFWKTAANLWRQPTGVSFKTGLNKGKNEHPQSLWVLCCISTLLQHNSFHSYWPGLLLHYFFYENATKQLKD